MEITIYTGYEKYIKRGTISVSFDRITNIQLYIPNGFYYRFTPESIAAEWEAEKTGNPLITHNIYKRESDYKFQIKKLSKAEIPYRKGGMTHRVLSNELMNYINQDYLYTKLKWVEVVLIKYNLNNFVWQTKEFKKHIYFHIATNLTSAFLGVLGTIFWFKSCTSTIPQPDTQNKSTTNELIQKTSPLQPLNKNGVSDSNYQYQPVKDSAIKAK